MMKKGLAGLTVDAVLLVVGSIATVLSVKWTFDWQVYTGDPWWEALGFSLVVVLFAVMVFEFAVEEASRGKKKAVFFFVMWAVVAAYSMQTTVAGQYVGVKEAQAKRLEVDGEQRAAGRKIAMLLDEERRIAGEVEGLRERRDQVLRVLDGIGSVEDRFKWKKNSGEMEGELEEIDERIRELGDELGRIAGEKMRLVEMEVKEEETGSGGNVFKFYADVLSMDVGIVEFGLAVFRGVILDTVNILCFMLVMLRGKRDGELGKDFGREVGERESDVDGGEGGELEEDSKEESEYGYAVKRIAEEAWREGRKGTRFPGEARCSALGIDPRDYQLVVREGVLRGCVVKRNGILKRNELMGRDEWEREMLTEG